MPRSDEDLMLAVRGGHESAFGEIVERHQGPLLRFFVRLGADSAQAEDCAQDVFVKLYRAREGYFPKAKFTTYLYRIARNHWIDVVRARRASPAPVSLDAPLDGTEEPATLASRIPAAGGEDERRELLEELERAIARLPEEQRLVFVLGEVQGLPYVEVGEILEIPVGTVKSRMHAAVHRLREILAPRRVR